MRRRFLDGLGAQQSASYGGGDTTPVKPYAPPPQVVYMPYLQTPRPMVPPTQVNPVAWMIQTQAQPKVTVTQAPPPRSATLESYYADKKKRQLERFAEQRRQMEERTSTQAIERQELARAAVLPTYPLQRAVAAPKSPAPVRKAGTWSDEERRELEMAKTAAREQGLFFKCTDAAYAVKSAVDGLGLTRLNVTLWRWKTVSGTAHSVVVVYPKWGTPNMGFILDQWWLPTASTCYAKSEREGGHPYKGADWEKSDPTSVKIRTAREKYLEYQEKAGSKADSETPFQRMSRGFVQH